MAGWGGGGGGGGGLLHDYNPFFSLECVIGHIQNSRQQLLVEEFTILFMLMWLLVDRNHMSSNFFAMLITLVDFSTILLFFIWLLQTLSLTCELLKVGSYKTLKDPHSMSWFMLMEDNMVLLLPLLCVCWSHSHTGPIFGVTFNTNRCHVDGPRRFCIYHGAPQHFWNVQNCMCAVMIFLTISHP